MSLKAVAGMTEQIATSTTGGTKGRKPEQYSLIPTEFLAEVARVYAYGAEKYSRDNWLSGYPWSWSYDALQRHIIAFWSGQETDPESGRHHLAHAAFHLASLFTYSEQTRYVEHDDRPQAQWEGPLIEVPVIQAVTPKFKPGDLVDVTYDDCFFRGVLVMWHPKTRLWGVRPVLDPVKDEYYFCSEDNLVHV
jgi:hypothetical protein